MTTHNPIEYANSLSSKLATRERHVCTFLGAGAASACGLSDVSALQREVLSELSTKHAVAFENQLAENELEDALSRIRSISALVNEGQSLDDLTAEDAAALDEAICREIVQALDIEQADIDPMLYFATWAARGDYHRPVEVFTVNYDLLLETAFEKVGARYFDGFVGNLNARFQTELVERTKGANGDEIPSSFVRLWKVHGSINWVRKDGDIVRVGQEAEESAAAIYPSDRKYEESRRVPFLALQDRFRRALHEDETILIISGYGFGDQHLNEIIFEAATRCKRSEFIAFCYSEIPEKLAERAEKIPNIQAIGPHEAIIGGNRGEWETPRDETENGDLVWKDGKMALRDFRNLSKYLARNLSVETQRRSETMEEQLAEMLSETDEEGSFDESIEEDEISRFGESNV
ncbi:SIR2 family protein [Natrialba asiatica]|uniref:SIR2 family protein n=1 Tax=Natrialba asiatica TaxID=64602 RepID=UPI000AA48729|nr:SIR2 family protein [Natrialba asiatica]